MTCQLDSWKAPVRFQEWLLSLDPETPLGIAGGFNQHPFPRWQLSLGEPVTIWVRREVPGVFLYHDHSGGRILIPPGHWLSRFCHALMIPDAYRTVTAADCIRVLAQVVLNP